jgi:hypothetical protein
MCAAQSEGKENLNDCERRNSSCFTDAKANGQLKRNTGDEVEIQAPHLHETANGNLSKKENKRMKSLFVESNEFNSDCLLQP